MDVSVLLGVIVAVATGGGAYAAIRADLARLHELALAAKSSADRAHERINKMVDFHGHASR